jgi:Fur family peroxide stress response transcriptional regulator
MITKESIISQLREKGLNVTSQRLAIIHALIEQRDLHPSARLIYEKAKKKKKSLSLSTTYATLNEFARHGIIRTLRLDKREDRCEGNLEEHIHLICDRCKRILDYRTPITLDKREVAKKTGFIVTDTRLAYYGLCRECRRQKGAFDNPLPFSLEIRKETL